MIFILKLFKKWFRKDKIVNNEENNIVIYMDLDSNRQTKVIVYQ